jgi:hypothetical protein
MRSGSSSTPEGLTACTDDEDDEDDLFIDGVECEQPQHASRVASRHLKQPADALQAPLSAGWTTVPLPVPSTL